MRAKRVAPLKRPPSAGRRIAHPESLKDAELGSEIRVALRAAREAARVLKRYWKKSGLKIDSKGYDNPVTAADLEADSTLRRILSAAFPDYGWLSEETVDNPDRLRKRRVWIVDPLDGTKEFIAGIPEFVVAIALVEDGTPILGVTCNPIRKEMFWAARGLGCHFNSHRVRVSRRRVISRATVLASRSETKRGEWLGYGGKFRSRPMGSVAYKLALVAAGKADATFTRTPKNEWDVCSGAALISEAGGTMTDISGRRLSFNRKKVKLAGMLADNGALHALLLALVGTPVRGRRVS